MELQLAPMQSHPSSHGLVLNEQDHINNMNRMSMTMAPTDLSYINVPNGQNGGHQVRKPFEEHRFVQHHVAPVAGFYPKTQQMCTPQKQSNQQMRQASASRSASRLTVNSGMKVDETSQFLNLEYPRGQMGYP
jgi:hypothetical protein